MRPEEDDERDLIRQAQKGCQRSVGRLFTQNKRTLDWFLSRFALSPEDREDFKQEVYLRAYRDIKSFDPDGPARFSTWMNTIAFYLHKNHSRRQKRWVMEKITDTEMQTDLSPDRILESKQTLQLIDKVLSTSRHRARQVIYLYAVEGLAGEEIAKALGCPRGTVGSSLCYTRKRVAEAMGK